MKIVLERAELSQMYANCMVDGHVNVAGDFLKALKLNNGRSTSFTLRQHSMDEFKVIVYGTVDGEILEDECYLDMMLRSVLVYL